MWEHFTLYIYHKYTVYNRIYIDNIIDGYTNIFLVWGRLRLIKRREKRFMKSVNCSRPGYTSIAYSKIENIPYNLIFTTKFNDSSILNMIISWD